MLTRADLIELLKSNTDEGWLTPLLEDPDSAAVINAIAAVFERVSISVDNDCNAGLIGMAPGGRPGVSLMTLERPVAGLAGTIPKGTSYRSTDGTYAVLTMDLGIGAGILSTVAPLETVRKTELVNTVDGPQWIAQPSFNIGDASDTTPVVIRTLQPHQYLAGEIVNVSGVAGNDGANGSFPIVVTGPDTFELTGSAGTGTYSGGGLVQPAPFNMVPTVATAIEGGAIDALSAHGRERGQLRQPGELDDAYRARIRNIPDAVSPRAIIAAVNGIAQQQKLPTFELLEPFRDGATPALKTSLNLGSFDSMFGDVDFCDDIAAISRREATDYFELTPLSVPRDPDTQRFFTDDSFVDDPVFGFLDVLNHPVLVAGFLAIAEVTDRKRAGGVAFDIVVPGWVDEIGTGADAAPGAPPGVTVFVLAPPAGKLWRFVDAIFGHTPAGPSFMHAVRFDFEDATFFVTDFSDVAWAERLTFADLAALTVVKRLTSISGILAGDGATPLNMSGHFRVVEVTP